MAEKPFEEMTPFEQKQDKARNIFQQMQETIRANQQRFLNKRTQEINAKEVNNKMTGQTLDASIAAEADKKLKKVILPPLQKNLCNKMPEVLETIFEQDQEYNENDVIEEAALEEAIQEEAVEELSKVKDVFYPPDPAETNIDDLLGALDTLSQYLGNVNTEVSFLGDNIHNSDYETSDFLHSIELSQFSDEEKVDIFNKIHEIRQRRRSYKVRLEYIRELEVFLANNTGIVNKINALRGKLRSLKEKVSTAQFYSKIRTDIKQDDKVHVGFRATGK